MGSKAGAMFLILGTLVCATIFLFANKGFTTGVGNEVENKMFGTKSFSKEGGEGDHSGKSENEGKEKKPMGLMSMGLNGGYKYTSGITMDKEGKIKEKTVEYNTKDTYVLFIPNSLESSYVGEHIKGMSEQLEASKTKCARSGVYCFDVKAKADSGYGYKYVSRDLVNDIQMDTSKININRAGIYPVSFTIENKDTGEISKVVTTYSVVHKDGGPDDDLKQNYEDKININLRPITVEKKGDKNQIRYENVVLKGDIPTLQELIDNDLLSVVTNRSGEWENLSNDGFEMDVPGFNRDVPGTYLMDVKYTDSKTGKTYRTTGLIYYLSSNRIQSDLVS